MRQTLLMVVGVLLLSLAGCDSGTPASLAKSALLEAPAPPLRGTLFDRNGVVLAVSDREVWQLVFHLDEVLRAYRAKHGGEVPMEEYQYADPAEDRTIVDMSRIFEEMVTPLLKERSLVRSYDADRMNWQYDAYAANPPAFVYAASLSPEERGRAEAARTKVPGLELRTAHLRRYPFKALAAPVLGHVTQSDNKHPDDVERGELGMEEALNDLLTPPRQSGGAPADASLRGADVHLTLDLRHQYIVERALRESQPAIVRGTVVLMDVDTGDVLAMASAPSYDPNDFIPVPTSARIETEEGDATQPLLNRTVRRFAPGSTFKVVTALAGICAGKQESRFHCSGKLPSDKRGMQCWIAQQEGRGHGNLALRDALRWSCNAYFYQLGEAIGLESFESTAALLGLGKTSGLPVGQEEGESPGVFLGEAWKSRRFGGLGVRTVGEVANGGSVELTPLQMAGVMIPIANGGTVWRPRLIDSVTSAGNPKRIEKRPLQRAANLHERGLTDRGLDSLRQGLRDVVTGGTAQAAHLPHLAIAGKSGTALNWTHDGEEFVRDLHAIFIAYAPVEKPRWAICVIVQGGQSGGACAAPVAARILEQVHALENSTLEVTPVSLEPITGNFEPLEAISYPVARPNGRAHE